LTIDHLIDRHHAILGCASAGMIGKDVDTARDLDELRDPPNRIDQRIVPFLEEYPRSFRQLLGTASGVSQACFEGGYELESPFARTNHRTDRSDHREDPCDASLVEGMDV
jgi:hypothetical protein